MLRRLRRTEGLDGLLQLYKRLEKRGRALLLCLLCAEAGWLVLVNAWLRLERAYLKLLFQPIADPLAVVPPIMSDRRRIGSPIRHHPRSPSEAARRRPLAVDDDANALGHLNSTSTAAHSRREHRSSRGSTPVVGAPVGTSGVAIVASVHPPVNSAVMPVSDGLCPIDTQF